MTRRGAGHFALAADAASGYGALYSNNGNANTTSGQGALYDSTTGSNNTAVGYTAASSAVTGTENVYLGAHVVGSAADTNGDSEHCRGPDGAAGSYDRRGHSDAGRTDRTGYCGWRPL